MSTKNPRINVTFEESTVKVLIRLAEGEDKSVASLVRELVLEALDRREDKTLSKIAEILDVESAKTHTHEDAWK